MRQYKYFSSSRSQIFLVYHHITSRRPSYLVMLSKANIIKNDVQLITIASQCFLWFVITPLSRWEDIRHHHCHNTTQWNCLLLWNLMTSISQQGLSLSLYLNKKISIIFYWNWRYFYCFTNWSLYSYKIWMYSLYLSQEQPWKLLDLFMSFYCTVAGGSWDKPFNHLQVAVNIYLM